MDNLISALKSFDFTEDQVNQAISKVNILSIKKNTNLIVPGELCNNLYYILDGGFVCRKLNSEEFKTINFFLYNLHPFMICVDSYFTGEPTACELRCIKDSTIIEVPKHHIDALVANDRRFLEFYNFLVTQAFIETVAMKQKLISMKPFELYNDIINHFPQIVHTVPSMYIAEFMGISPEWLSKVKKRKNVKPH